MQSVNETAIVTELDSLVAAARSAMCDDRIGEAQQLLAQITKRDPQDTEAWLWRAFFATTTEEKRVALSKLFAPPSASSTQ
jgi:hypothetical protein